MHHAGPTEAEDLVARLAGATPGPALVAELAAVDPAAADDATLLEAVAAWHKVAAWAASRTAAVVNELRRRREAQRRESFLGDEIAARLGATRRAGESIVADAWCLERLPEVWDALDAGRVDTRKARVLAEELLALPADAQPTVAESAVRSAETLTVPQLRALIRAAAIEHDPAAADKAHARERARRRVELDPVRDGMAWLRAYLPAPDAVAVHTALTALADARPGDDTRPIDARRADALVDLAVRCLETATTPHGQPLPRRHGRRPHVQVTVAASTLAGLDEAPARLAGYGPITAATARAIAQGDVRWRAVGVDAATGEARTGPGDGGRAGEHGGDGDGSHGRGGGPAGYRPPQRLRDEVVARDVTCTFPGCRLPASRCDIDHIAPFDPRRPAEEQTVEPNLHALCRHHHLLKTFGGWDVRRDAATGRTEWRAPTGHRYARQPEPAVATGHLDDPEPDEPDTELAPDDARHDDAAPPGGGIAGTPPAA